MKKVTILCSLFLLLIGFQSSKAQILDPVEWDYMIENINGSEATLVFKATMEKGWHVYTQHITDPMGPIPTTFTFKESADYELIGKTSEEKGETVYDPNFEMELKYFSDVALFKQKIKLKNNKPFKITGELEYMACDEKQCLPPEFIEFEFAVSKSNTEKGSIDKSESTPNNKKTESKNSVIDIAPLDLGAETDEANNNEYKNSDKAAEVVNDAKEAEAEKAVIESKKEVPSDSKKEKSNLSFWAIFIKGLAGGFIALLTPCVFPMIPLTVSFFTKQSKTRAKGITNAIIYGLSIIAIYVALGYLVTIIFGADALNALSTNVFFNLFFFVLLVVFAISFFGAFEITLPSSWINKADRVSDKGGLLGIFFMAFTLSLVSFSCTGPIIGTLLVDAAVGGEVAGPLIGMFGFAFALALPFMVFAAFPGWLNSLPQSGGWLNSVKVVLGFLELAFAFKFLSNADLVMQAGLLQRELFIAIWIAVFGTMTLYLLGFVRFPHDDESRSISVPRAMFGMLALMFTIYMIPGLWGAPLKIISGFPPPSFYSESPQGLTVAGTSSANSHTNKNTAHCPHNLNCFHDYEEGLAYAKEVNKPLMLDFTGWACVNCRKMEEQVWSDPQVLSRLRENVVLVSLYVDEKIALPEQEQIEVKIGKKTKTLKTVGNKWSYFQAQRFNTNSQPFYVMLDNNENQLHESAAYDPNIPKFVDWLDRGVDLYHNRDTNSLGMLK